MMTEQTKPTVDIMEGITTEEQTKPPSPLNDDKSFFEFLYELQRENKNLFFNAVNSVQIENRRIILIILLSDGGTTDVNAIQDRMSASDRTVRGQLKKLEDLGLIERLKGPAPVVSFASYEAKYLVNHVLDCYCRMYDRDD